MQSTNWCPCDFLCHVLEWPNVTFFPPKVLKQLQHLCISPRLHQSPKPSQGNEPRTSYVPARAEIFDSGPKQVEGELRGQCNEPTSLQGPQQRFSGSWHIATRRLAESSKHYQLFTRIYQTEVRLQQLLHSKPLTESMRKQGSIAPSCSKAKSRCSTASTKDLSTSQSKAFVVPNHLSSLPTLLLVGCTVYVLVTMPFRFRNLEHRKQHKNLAPPSQRVRSPPWMHVTRKVLKHVKEERSDEIPRVGAVPTLARRGPIAQR